MILAQPLAAQQCYLGEAFLDAIPQGLLQVVVLLAFVGMEDAGPLLEVLGPHRVKVADHGGGGETVGG